MTVRLERVPDYWERLERAEAKDLVAGTCRDRCDICTRPLGARPWAVFLTGEGEAVPVAEVTEEALAFGLGWLTVGPECVKTVPLEYRRRIDLR